MKTYVAGPPGTRKSTRVAARLVELLESGVRPDRILLLVPQQAQVARFRDALAGVRAPHRPRGEPDIVTLYGLAQRHVGLFFPLIAPLAGFADPSREPVFINVELAQHFLNRIVEPRAAEFEDLKLGRPRLLGQILDSMNKAAECGIPLDEIAPRLSAAWPGDTRRLNSYRHAQRIAQEFREFCLRDGLLDFSLLIETYARHLMRAPAYQAYVSARYRHVLADGVDENPPVTHDLIRQLLGTCDSALLVEDDPGGFRLFLGADPVSAQALAQHCDTVERVMPPEQPAAMLGAAIARAFDPATPAPAAGSDLRAGLAGPPVNEKFWVTMVRRVADEIIARVTAGTPAGEIAVLAPFVEDVLRFELEEALRAPGIALRVLRPSRPLYDHPVARALATLARLARPEWKTAVTAPELARALSVCIDGLDVARAQVIADAALTAAPTGLAGIEESRTWERAGLRFRERYHALGQALAVAAPARLDLFWQHLFGDVLSREGFGLHADRDAALACDRLIHSARAFHEALEALPPGDSGVPADPGRAFLDLLSLGVLAAQYTPEQAPGAHTDGVLLAPIYAYLTADQRSRVQFWLDINSLGWYERIHQPLTHPHVLSRRWTPGPGRVWTDEDEHREQRGMASRVLRGLAHRCSEGILFASSQLGLSGQEDDGPLARAIQIALGPGL